MFADATGGWTGGDATFSAPLPDGRTAWLFGDTFIGGLTTAGGRDKPFPDIRNSLVAAGRLPDDALRRDDRRAALVRADRERPAGHVVLAERDRRARRPGAHVLDADGQAGGRPVRGRRRGPRHVRPRPARRGRQRGRPGAAGPVVGRRDRRRRGGRRTYVFGIQDVAPLTKTVVLARTPLRDLDGPWEYRTATGWSDQLARRDAGARRPRPRVDPAQRAARRRRLGARQPGRPRRRRERLALGHPRRQLGLARDAGHAAAGRSGRARTTPSSTPSSPPATSCWSPTTFIPDTTAQGMADASLYRPRFVESGEVKRRDP